MAVQRGRFLRLAASAAALPALSCIPWAQAYPTRPVRLMVPLAPAGGTDCLARLMGQTLASPIPRSRSGSPTTSAAVLN
jgi:tripartite-type tricarboxylate transporter receptor subunit TctC